MQVLIKVLSFERKLKWNGYFVPVPMSWFEVASCLVSGQEEVFEEKVLKEIFLPF